ncbi:hypothetical protein GRX01_03470 [Halobaculum sp. WSA2]|uniref:Uncharacterized protein n=1 Tax=Halobaculum saliterrae TaxID=2073113 RepID=A0A6B0SPR2_9EURY|nr:hypothetical protein [Halobaculum saliterrae]MXR40417.1 hypothetical protein [Halobaculum saliterrae]
MPSETPPPSYRVAIQTLPYTFPIAGGFVLLSWGVLELASAFTDAYWVITELFSPLIVLTLGTGLILFGSSGAISQALRATIKTSTEDQ